MVWNGDSEWVTQTANAQAPITLGRRLRRRAIQIREIDLPFSDVASRLLGWTPI